MGRDPLWLSRNIYRNDFNSHARVGRDITLKTICRKTKYFNSHARVGRDTEISGEIPYKVDFNSHARVGRDNVSCSDDDP